MWIRDSSLGLDLKGGMNVILEVSVPDVIKVLADNKTDEAFNQALVTAAKQATLSLIHIYLPSCRMIREFHHFRTSAMPTWTCRYEFHGH